MHAGERIFKISQHLPKYVIRKKADYLVSRALAWALCCWKTKTRQTARDLEYGPGPDHGPSGPSGMKATAGPSWPGATAGPSGPGPLWGKSFRRPQIFSLEISGPKVVLLCKFSLYWAVQALAIGPGPFGFSLTSLMDDSALSMASNRPSCGWLSLHWLWLGLDNIKLV